MPRCASVRATTKPSPPLLPRPHSTPTLLEAEIVERRLHRRDRLAAGVLHQHDGRHADVVDRLTIGLAHLLRVQHSHELIVRGSGFGGSGSVQGSAVRLQRSHARLETVGFADAWSSSAQYAYVRLLAICAGRFLSTDRLRMPSRRSCRSTITDSSTARASTRRCAPTTASRFSTIATCAACGSRRDHLSLDVPFDDAALLGWISDTTAAAGDLERGLHPRPADARRRRSHLRHQGDAQADARHHRQASRRRARRA